MRRLQRREMIINELVGRYNFTRAAAECIYDNHHLFVDLDEDEDGLGGVDFND